MFSVARRRGNNSQIYSDSELNRFIVDFCGILIFLVIICGMLGEVYKEGIWNIEMVRDWTAVALSGVVFFTFLLFV